VHEQEKFSTRMFSVFVSESCCGLCCCVSSCVCVCDVVVADEGADPRGISNHSWGISSGENC
jgi:hypothetical protein